MEKKGKGKTIIIVILVFAVLGLGGYIAYDKVNESNTTNSLEKEVKQLNNEIATLKTEKQENNEVINPIDKLIGNWSYEETIKSDNAECTATIKLELKKDGTYTYESGHTCAGGIEASGRWSISADKIYLQNEKCLPVPDGGSNNCIYPNCQTEIELYYTGEQISAKRIGGTIVNLVKQ